jgi:hypothetical protein
MGHGFYRFEPSGLYLNVQARKNLYTGDIQVRPYHFFAVVHCIGTAPA